LSLHPDSILASQKRSILAYPHVSRLAGSILILGGAALQRCMEDTVCLRLQPLRYLRA
jgi:hypothetical protein